MKRKIKVIVSILFLCTIAIIGLKRVYAEKYDYDNITTYEELLQAMTNAASQGGHKKIRITEDIEFSSSIRINGSYDITIDGGNHTLSEKNSTNIFLVENEQTLTLKNINFKANIQGSSASPIIHAYGGIVNLESGTNFTEIVHSNNAIAVLISQNGICNMYDGVTITNSSSVSTGAITIHKGTFNMYGGTISDLNNTAVCMASNPIGGDRDTGTFNMYGGTISNCTYQGNYGYGGAVFFYNDKGTFNMSGGSIENSVGKNGGAVFMYNGIGIFTGGTISGNTSNVGGGICVNGGTTTIGSNMIIKENKGNQGGGVCAIGGTLIIEDGAKIYDNVSPTGSNIARSKTANLTLGKAPIGTKMSCGGEVDGWYRDASGSGVAWNNKHADGFCNDASSEEYIVKISPNNYVKNSGGTVVLKAAHSKTYSIIYNKDDNTQYKIVNHLHENDNIVPPEVPSKYGYNFTGWNPILPENLIIDSSDSFPIYTATWEKIEYTYDVISIDDYKVDSNKTLLMKINAPYKNLSEIYIDDVLLDDLNYSVIGDPTEISISSDYMSKLKLGSHNIKVIYNDNKVDAVFKVIDNKVDEKNPKTSDNILFYISISFISLVMFIITGICMNKKITEKVTN